MTPLPCEKCGRAGALKGMLTFPNVTPAAFAIVLDQLRKEGSSVERYTVSSAAISPELFLEEYTITGHHWPLGDIRANVVFDGATVTVDVAKPSAWESVIGERIGKSIEAAKRTVAGDTA